jgi:hypothetical protein
MPEKKNCVNPSGQRERLRLLGRSSAGRHARRVAKGEQFPFNFLPSPLYSVTGMVEAPGAVPGCRQLRPGCPPIRTKRGEDKYATPCAEEPPAPCIRCSRPPTVIGIVRDPDYYGNADRLREVTT